MAYILISDGEFFEYILEGVFGDVKECIEYIDMNLVKEGEIAICSGEFVEMDEYGWNRFDNCSWMEVKVSGKPLCGRSYYIVKREEK